MAEYVIKLTFPFCHKVTFAECFPVVKTYFDNLCMCATLSVRRMSSARAL